jgi:hypothetical protein
VKKANVPEKEEILNRWTHDMLLLFLSQEWVGAFISVVAICGNNPTIRVLLSREGKTHATFTHCSTTGDIMGIQATEDMIRRGQSVLWVDILSDRSHLVTFCHVPKPSEP